MSAAPASASGSPRAKWWTDCLIRDPVIRASAQFGSTCIDLAVQVSATSNTWPAWTSKLSEHLKSARTNVQDPGGTPPRTPHERTGSRAPEHPLRTNVQTLAALRHALRTNVQGLRAPEDPLCTNVQTPAALRHALRTNVQGLRASENPLRTNVQAGLTLENSLCTNVHRGKTSENSRHTLTIRKTRSWQPSRPLSRLNPDAWHPV